MIIDVAVAKAPAEHLALDRRDRSMSVSYAIDFTSWAQASPEERLQLLTDNVLRSVGDVPEVHLTKADARVLLDAITQAQPRVARRLLQ